MKINSAGNIYFYGNGQGESSRKIAKTTERQKEKEMIASQTLRTKEVSGKC